MSLIFHSSLTQTLQQHAVPLIGLTAGFLASLLGWQINTLSIHRGLERGRTASFCVGWGAVMADLFFVFLGLTGAHALLDHHEVWIIAKFLGTATLIGVGLKIFFEKPVPKKERHRKKRSPTQSFILGFVVVAGNPSLLFMWIGLISFLATHFPDADLVASKLVFLIAFFIGGSFWFFILSVFILRHIREWGEERLHWISRISAMAMLLAGCILVFERF